MPAAPAAPPSAAPTAPAAPSAPATPSPAPAAPLAPAVDGLQPLDPFGQLDRLAKEGKLTPEPAKKEAPPVKEPDAKNGEPAKAPEAAKVEPAKVEPAKDDQDFHNVPPAALRKRVRDQNDELKKLRAEIETSKTSTKATDDPEKKALTEKLTAAEARLSELQGELKFAKFESTDEYKREYLAPVESAFRSAYGDIGQLQVTDADGNMRQATTEDFNALMHMPLASAIQHAKATFGDAAHEVLAHRRHIIQLNERRTEAVKKFQGEAAERERNTLAESAKFREQQNTAWATENTALAERHADLFKPDDDEAGNKELEEGYKVADMAFGDLSKMAPQDRVKLHAIIRNAAAAFPRMVYRNKQLTAKLATIEGEWKAKVDALEKELAGYRKSEPGAGDPAGVGKVEDELDWSKGIDRLAGRK